MANLYFQFKNFIIYQDKCSMKVCTDACILGAWTANAIILNHLKVNNCLDVGSGTGLLSVMLSQKINAFVDAIEIDANAFEQTVENFKRSAWSKHLKAFHSDAKYFLGDIKYDFIISNPPFYEDSLLSPQKNNNIARHDEGLKLTELMVTITKNLDSSGSFSILLPYHRLAYFENLANEYHFFLQEKLLIKSTPQHAYFRGILLFSHTKCSPLINELIIKQNQKYSENFMALMKEYY